MTDYRTPGVYVKEADAFPPSIVAAATAIPAFVGVVAGATGGEAKKIRSLKEYEKAFPDALKPNSNEIILYHHLQLFYLNGGGECYVLPVADFNTVTDLFEPLEKIEEITLIVLADAATDDNYMGLCEEALKHCADQQNRFAILDVVPSTDNPTPDNDANAFRNAIGTKHLNYGAAYYPYLKTTLSDQAMEMPPSAAIAGIYAATDRNRGVWQAPANVALSGVSAPSLPISDEQQKGLNIPTGSAVGKAVNAIRLFPGQGTLVWGARTLDGESNDWRYIQVRRLVIFAESSIKASLRNFVFEPNTAATWINVKSMTETFLHGLWRQGGLAGDNASDAFRVQVGLGDTMNEQDILDGQMRISVALAAVRPAEFIVLNISQMMQK